MASLIQKMMKDAFGITDQRGLFLGLDSSGRTTTLYQLKLGTVVATIPTIGFNVETVRHTNVDYTLWDVGGCDKIRPLWRHYFQGSSFFVFFVDSNDRDRMEEATDELHRLLAENSLKGVPVCIAANKQDLPNAMAIDELKVKLRLFTILDRPWHVEAISAKQGDGLHEMMSWIHSALLKNPPNEKQKKEERDFPAKPEDAMAVKIEATLLEWLEQEDEEDDVFLNKFAQCSLETWDHRTHLRIAWLFMKHHGRRDGMAKIFAGIKHFIENSPRTHRSRGTTFHETMTYFWVHMVHYAMVTTPSSKDSFPTFLLLNPQLANGGLFLHYYSKTLMLQTASSRMEVVLPDIRPLPSLVTDVEAPSTRRFTTSETAPRAAPLSDAEFWLQWQDGKLSYWGHEARLRAIWLCLKHHGRKDGVKRAFSGLETFEKAGHHVTMAYFWIQMTDFCLRKEIDNSPTFGLFIQKPTSQLLRNPDLIEKYYIQKTLDLGKTAFQVPDRKALPSLI